MVSRRRYTPRERMKVAYEQRYTCAKCAQLLPPDWQLDHVVPLSEGGGNERENVQALCVSCHTDKSVAATQTRGAPRAPRAARKKRPSVIARLLRAVGLLL
jgi:5-methylcytosine-specific restriction endonuclease McrA